MEFYIFSLLVIGEFPGNFSQFFHSVQIYRCGALYHSAKVSFISWALFATRSQASLLKHSVFLHGLHSLTPPHTQLEHRVAP